jgi:hypothetical protein
MTDERLATLTIERAGQSEATRTGLTADEVATIVEQTSGEQDVTVLVQPKGLDERVLVAVDRTRAFLGLERPDGPRQFALHDGGSSTTPFVIGGQVSDIENRYLMDLPTAASVVREWLVAGEASARGTWERQ